MAHKLPFAALLVVLLAPEATHARVSILRDAAADAAGADPSDARFPRESGLVAVEARYDYRCAAHGDGIASVLDEHLVVRNPTAAKVAALAFVNGVWGDGPRSVTIDGAPAAFVGLTPEEAHAFSCAYQMAVFREALADCRAGGDLGDAVRFVVPPGAQVELVVHSTRVVAGDYTSPVGSDFIDALTTRHPLLASGFYQGATELLSTETMELLTLRGNPKIRVRVTAPASWSVAGPPFPIARASNAGQTTTSFETDMAATEAQRLPDLPNTPPPAGLHHIGPFLLETHVVRPGWQFAANGGPYLGVGARVGDAHDEHVRFRVGYEAAFFVPWILGAVAADVDTSGRVVLAPVLEVGAPCVPQALLMPSFALGVGGAVQVAPTTRGGLRLLASASWPVVGIEATMDYFPARGAEPTDLQWSVLGRLGF